MLLHTSGEEIGMFPTLAEIAPHIDDTYLVDHIEKENTLILPFIEEPLAHPEQGAMIGKILSTIPPEKSPTVIPWIIERTPTDRLPGLVDT